MSQFKEANGAAFAIGTLQEKFATLQHFPMFCTDRSERERERVVLIAGWREGAFVER